MNNDLFNIGVVVELSYRLEYHIGSNIMIVLMMVIWTRYTILKDRVVV
jgi:hypothetical protein